MESLEGRALESEVVEAGDVEEMTAPDIKLKDYRDYFSTRLLNIFFYERIETVKDLAGRTDEDFLRMRGLGRTTLNEIRRFLSDLGHELKKTPRARATRQRKITKEVIENAITHGARTRHEIAEKLGVHYQSLISRMKEYGINLAWAEPNYPNKKINDQIAERLIKRGLPATQIADRFGVSKQRAYEYIVARGLHDAWKKSREMYKTLEQRRINAISDLVALIQKTAYERASWEEQKAFEYISSRQVVQPNSYYTESLTKLFRTYREARERGEKLSLEELGEKSGFHFTSVGKILKRVGLEPMHGARERISPLAEEQKRKIVRAVKHTTMSCSDIAYFLGLPGRYNVSQLREVKRIQKGKDKRLLCIVGLDGSRGGSVPVSYRLGFEIYEMQREGYFRYFSTQEVAESLDTKAEVVEHVLANKREYYPEIMRALDVLYSK